MRHLDRDAINGRLEPLEDKSVVEGELIVVGAEIDQVTLSLHTSMRAASLSSDDGAHFRLDATYTF